MSIRVWQPLGFIPEIVTDHLEEAAFLALHRRRALARRGASWEEAEIVEVRLERHLDALVEIGREAFMTFEDQLLADDPGAVFTMAAWACQLPDISPFEAVADAAAAAPEPSRLAIAEALRWSADRGHDRWKTMLGGDPRPAVRAVVLDASGATEDVAEAHRALEDPSPQVALAAARWLARAGQRVDASRLGAHLRSADPEVVRESVRTLSRLGHPQAVELIFAAAAAGPPEFFTDALGVAAVHTDGATVSRLAAGRTAPIEDPYWTWLAHGLAGDAAAGASLLERLDGPWELPDQSAEVISVCRALECITGADHYPGGDPDEIEPAALDALRRDWHAAWKDVQKQIAGGRCRGGEPVSPGTLAADLQRSGHPARAWVHAELVLRHQCSIEFHPGATVARQRSAARSISQWAETAGPRSPQHGPVRERR